VWYFGKNTRSYENGVGPADTEGSREVGVNGVKSGVVMYADPEAHINVSYGQEYLSGVAENKAEVLERPRIGNRTIWNLHILHHE
jgi:hypothetical protein